VKAKSSNNGLRRELGFFSAFLLVVASMVGTGIFTTSGFIVQELENAQAMLLCWVIGGIFALCGALCYGELGAMFPRAGGEYVFLRESFGKGMAFLSGWISLIVGFSAPIAAASIAFATYSLRALSVYSGVDAGIPLFGADLLTVSPVTILATITIVAFSLVHYQSLFLGSRAQNALTVFKVIFVLGFVASGLCFGAGSTANLSQQLDLKVVVSGRFAISLIFVSFAYSGWNAATYLGAEVKNPGRNFPLSLFSATLFVMFAYLLVNITYVYALPRPEMSGVIEVGAKAAVSLFGVRAASLFSGAIAICILSVIGAMILTGPRVYYAMARDRVFFSLFGKLSARHNTPGHSILLQAVLAIFMVVTTAFDALLLYVGFTLSLFAMLTVVGVVWLRVREPSLARPYKTFGFPLTPAVFILGNLWIIYVAIKIKPIVSLCGLATIGIGALAYQYFKRC